jgi:hypothetical protein
MAQNIQTFAGDVVVPGTLKANLVTIEDPILTLGSNNYVDKASNTGFIINRFDSNANVAFYFDETNEQLRLAYTASVGTDKNIVVDENTDLEINVFGYVSAYGFRGDGGLLSNLVTDLQSVTEYGASSDQTLVLSNVTTALDATEGNVVVAGNVTASTFFGDGANLTGIAATLEEIIINGNVTSNTMELQNATSLITTGKVGIANSAPQHDLSVGANLYVEDVGSNVLTVEGNISAHQLTLGTIEIVPGYGLENVTNISNISYQTLILSNAQTAFVSTAKAGIGIEPDAADVGAAGLHVDGHLRLGGAADNTDEEVMDIKAAGALNVLANESDTDNTNTGLLLRAGGLNESNIQMFGDLSTADKQYMSFATRSEERMRIHGDGNVSIGHTAGNYMLDVAGDANCVSLSIQDLTINTIGIAVTYDIDNILENGNVTTNVLTVGKVTVTDPTLAQTASNLVTWNPTTSEFEDSGGLISNKLAIVSEQPPAALTGDSTVIDGHGRYKVTSSSEGNEPNFGDWNCFNKATGGTNAWHTDLNYDTSTFLHNGAESIGGINGEWVKLELPYKTRLRHISLQARANDDTRELGPGTFSIIGSNDDSSWTLLKQITGVAASDYSSVTQKQFVIDASASYKYYALVVEKIIGGSYAQTNNRTIIGEWRLFTETFTVDAGVVSTTAASGLDVGYTEHPVEPMTDYHTYVEGHGTYEASASSEHLGTAWQMFDQVYTGGISTSGMRWFDLYNADGTYQGSKYTADVGGTRYMGEWIQLKNPYAITLSHFKWFPVQNSEYRSPAKGSVFGSNDGQKWYKLTSWSSQTFTYSTGSQVQVNATTPYQYFRLVIENTGTSSDFTQWRSSAMEWRLFAEKPVTRMENVHISGDLSSETLQTGYIKWPRKSLKANESEGYVASASSTFNTLEQWQAWHAFNNYNTDRGLALSPNWQSAVSFNSSGEPLNGTAISFDGMDGEWIQIQMPNKIALSHFTIGRRNDNANSVNSGYMYGSNDGINWTRLVYFNGITYSLAPVNTAFRERVNVESKQSFNHYRLFITKINPAGGNYRAILEELQLFEAATGVGAAPTSAKLQVAGSLGMAKGSEFFAGDDVVMELPKHDRPLVKYPEVVMTTSQDVTTLTYEGYTVSASNDRGSSYRPWKAFDGLREDAGGWGTSNYYDSSTGEAKNTSTQFEGNYGEYLELQLPVMIKLEKVVIKPRDVDASKVPEDAPGSGYIYASNDGSDWTLLHSFSGLSYGGASSNGDATNETLQVNASHAYKYYRLQATSRSGQNGSDEYVNVAELEYWGYEEGDTSVDVVHRSIPNKPSPQHLEVYWDAADSNSYSFADSSNVYDLSGSGVTGAITGNNGFDAEYNAWVFDGSGDYISGTQGLGTGQPVHSQSVWFKMNANTGDYQYICMIGTNSTDDQSAITLNSDDEIRFEMYGTPTALTTDTKVVADAWYHVVAVYTGGNWNNTNCSLYVNGVKVVLNNGSNTTTSPTITGDLVRLGSTGSQWELNGSIANFRLFGKALNADQVRELYEYDAPRFGHRQNLVALHKGNLGVGVAHPTSRFEVAGADGLQEYPPKAMSDFETYMEGHGVFRASADSWSGSSGNILLYRPWKAFIKGTSESASTGDNSWLDSSGDFNSVSGVYEGSVLHHNGSVSGEYLQLELPYEIKLSSYSLAPWNYPTGGDFQYADFPRDFIIYGSKDYTNWDVLDTRSGQSSTSQSDIKTYNINSLKTYKYFTIVITKINTATYPVSAIYAAIGEWRLFGTPAPSSLEDGHLTLGKALTLPRVSGHAAGAETPRAESLVVHYDTTVDSVVSGTTVVDVSGNGFNGVLENGATYSSSLRAFQFDGTNDWLRAPINNSGGAWVHSMSFWFKFNGGSAGGLYSLVHIGAGASTQNIMSDVLVYTDGKIRFGFYDNDSDTATGLIDPNIWYHIVCTYNGGAGNASSRLVYINGQSKTITTVGAYTSSTLNLAANTNVYLGSQQGNFSFPGSISNFKLYDVVLTAEEVAMEYALGRTGKSLNLTDTALCLGGTVPRAQLDVRGGVVIGGNVGFGTTNPLTKTHIHQSGTDKNDGLRLSKSSSEYWNIYVSTLNDLHFKYGGGSYGGYISDLHEVNQIDFTGQHRSFIDGVPYTEYDNLEGLIVSANKNKYFDIDEDLTTGANAIQISQSLPLVSLSTKEKDKACFGVISGSEDPESREYSQGSFVSVVQKQKGDTRVYINSVGEGAMWVVNTAGPLESGDYITTSNVAGYGQRQESEFLANYTVAKITMDCDFNPQDQPIQRIKQSNVVETHYTGLVPVVKGVPHEWVTTTVTADDEWSNVSVTPPDVTYAEWSNLEANVQNTYTLTYTQTSNVVYDVKYTKTTTANVTAEDAWDAVHIEPSTVTYAEYSNLEANVQNTYSLTYTMTTKVEATEANYSNLSTEDKEFFVPTYYQLVEQTVDAEYPGAVKHETVTDRLENALDEHGQLQWEDDPSGATEKAYKIRYLDATGQQTDEANAVHIAAFVGCTYHCG